MRLSNGARLGNGVRLDNGARLDNGVAPGNGVMSWNGLDLGNGVQADPRIGRVDLRPGAILDCVRGPYFDATTGSRLEQWLATDPHERKLLLRYFVECALPTGTSVRLKVDGATEIIGRGVGNLGPSLRRGRMSVADQEKVSACLLARTNATGKKVELDLLGRDPGFEKPSDPAVFSVREATYSAISSPIRSRRSSGSRAASCRARAPPPGTAACSSPSGSTRG